MSFDLASVAELLERYHRGIALFEDAARSVPASHMDAPPAPEKWTARQIICHVADSEGVAIVRYRMIAAQPGSTLTAFDQELWASQTLYEFMPWEDALRAYVAMRQHNVNMLRGLPLEAWSRSAIHVERGENSLFKLVQHNAVHVEGHAGQVLKIQRGLASASV
jgi:hypothetical protein